MKKVATDRLEAGMVLAQDVYVAEESDSAVLKKGAQLTPRAVERLRGWKLDCVFVEGQGDETEHVGMLLQGAKSDVRPAPPVITQQLRSEALTTLETVFTGADSGFLLDPAAAQKLNHVVDQLVDSLVLAQNALVNINDLKSYDDYTYHHSLSVAVMSIGIGQALGVSGEELKHLGLCAIMHDIGKTAIPIEIIQKPAKLDPQEFDLIKTHSAEGFKALTGTAVGDDKLWRGVLHHHEKFDGSGYPDKLCGLDIPLWSRIISVADVYDALTSSRPYRTPMTPAEAIEYVMGGSGTAFDFDIVTALMRRVDLYPAGRVVELSDGRYALVLNNENLQRPVVEILGSGEVVDLYRDRSALNLVVRRLLPDLIA